MVSGASTMAGPVDPVAGPQPARVVERGVGPAEPGPPGLALARQRRVPVLQRMLGQGRLGRRHGHPEHEVVQVDAAGFVDHERAERLGELALELVVQRLDVLAGAQAEHRAGGALHVHLPAVEHVELEAELGFVDRQALGLQVGPRLVDQRVDHLVEGVVLAGQLLGDRGHHDHPPRRLVDVDDVHDRRPEGAEHRRRLEDHRLGQVAEEPRHVRRTGAAEGEQDEVLGVVAAQVDLAPDRRVHVLVDDAADQRGGLLDPDAHRPGDPGPDGLAPPWRGPGRFARRSRCRG